MENLFKYKKYLKKGDEKRLRSTTDDKSLAFENKKSIKKEDKKRFRSEINDQMFSQSAM